MNKTALLITTFNRPQYLKKCIDSLVRSDLSKLNTIMIVDDCSTDESVHGIIDNFIQHLSYAHPEIGHKYIKSTANKSIKSSLLEGCNFLFESGHNIVINLDADAIVRNDFVSKLLEAKEKYPSLIITGFNCNTLNKDGSVRHKHLYKENGYTFRESVGGINMCLGREQYLKYVKPALAQTLIHGGNWDATACINSMKDSLPICVIAPSVINHIGYRSSMGHSEGGEPPDVADDFKSLSLPMVTLISVDDKVDGIIKAADISCRDIEFGYVKLLSCEPSSDERVVYIERLGSKEAYSRFLMSDIVDYIDTPYFITIQADGYILQGDKFNNDWFNYDYIGSPWEWYTDGMNVGNGGASFRSKRLHRILKDDPKIFPTNDHLIKEYQEDHCIARIYRRYLENDYDIKFAPIEIARRFGIEAGGGVKPPNNKYSGQFCFHGFGVDFNNSDLPHIPYIYPNNQRKIL